MRSMRASQVPRDRSHRFVNWARTERSAPRRWHQPASEDELRALVRSAAGRGARLRVVGAGHSFSAIALPDDEAITLGQMTAPLVLDRARDHVTVPGGMRLRDLSAALAGYGLALPIVGSIQAQTVAGAIATGTHGSSLRHGNLASLVAGLRIVTGTGDVLRLGPDDERLDGARVHLGALGVVTQVTLPVQGAGRLHQTVEHIPVEAVAGLLPDIATSADYVKVWWLAHSPVAQVVRCAATTDPPTRRPSARTQRWIDENVMHRAVFPALVALQHRRPSITAGANRRLARVYLGAPSQVGDSTLMLNTPMPLRHRETEAAVPIERAPEALRRILLLFRDGRPAVNFPLEIRFVRGDAGWLSPAYGGDTCQIGAYTTNGPECSSYFASVWQAVRPLGARPHWGKELDHDAAELRSLYPRFDRFLELRDELDPRRVFAGAFLDRCLGP